MQTLTQLESAMVAEQRVLQKPKRSSAALGLFVAGMVLALSAPEFGQWYLAWVGLVPLLAGIFFAKTAVRAATNSILFGAGYALVYALFMFSLQPFMGIGGSRFIFPTILFYWLLCGLHQSLFFGLFGFIAHLIPRTLRLSLPQNPLKWQLLAGLTLPVLWVLIHNKLAAQPCILGIPWMVLEYSQYKQTQFIQCASLIGGIGIGGMIVLANLLAFSIICSLYRVLKGELSSREARLVTFGSACLLFLIFAIPNLFGSVQLASKNTKFAEERSTFVSIVQGVGAERAAKPEAEISRYLKLSRSAPSGICAWPEWALAVDLPNFAALHPHLKRITMEEKQSWLIGSNEMDAGSKRSYNVACAFNSQGEFLQPVYRKQIRVPFGEYVPPALKPFAGLFLPQAKFEASSGQQSISYDLEGGTVSPLLCLEILYPELSAASVRDGAQMLIDLSCITWFSSPAPGRQLIAASVFRALETSRFVVYATSTGPSAFVDDNGRIVVQTPFNKSLLISRDVSFRNVLTEFVKWYR